MSIKDLAKEVVKDITSNKFGDIRIFETPTYIAVDSKNNISDSSLPYILDNATTAIILLPYIYMVWTNTDKSQFVIFIDEKHIPSNNIEKNGWRLKFNDPYTSFNRTYIRSAIISNSTLELTLPVESIIEPKDIERIWKIFNKIHKDTTINELKLLGDLYEEMGGCPYSYSPRVECVEE